MDDVEAMKAYIRAQRNDYEAIRETLKQLHWGNTSTSYQTFSKITDRIFEELKARGWTPPKDKP